MKTLSALVGLMMAVPAFASHPHDRICVGASQLADGSTINLVVQWETGRSYETGDSATDPHTLVLEASSCLGDYSDLPCVKSKTDLATYQLPQMKVIPTRLKDSRGQLFFDGTFTLATEVLKGKIDNGQGKLVPATFKLSCVSQPRMTLDISQDDAKF